MFSLILPHLLRLPDETLPPLNTPTLNQWLRFGRYQAHQHNTAELYAQYLGTIRLPENTAWAVPMWQQIGMNTTQQLDSRFIAISEYEAQNLIDSLNTFYTGDAVFSALQPQIWQIQLPQMSEWHIPSVLDLDGQTDAMSRSEHQASAQWLQLSTEIQMFLHTHPINQARQQRGEIPINALWLWQPENGAPQANTFQAALTGSNSIWATISPSLHTQQPHDLAQWQRICEENCVAMEQTQLFSEDFAQSYHNADIWAYQDTLNQWENRFFAPLDNLLQTGKLKQIQLICEQGSLTIDARRWAFWKSKKIFNGKQLG